VAAEASPGPLLEALNTESTLTIRRKTGSGVPLVPMNVKRCGWRLPAGESRSRVEKVWIEYRDVTGMPWLSTTWAASGATKSLPAEM